MSFQLALANAWTRASCLSGPEDLLPLDCLRLLVNTRLDRMRGIITSRPGLVQLTTAPIGGGSVLAHSKLYGVTADYGYAHIGTDVWRLDAGWRDSSKVLLGGTATTVMSDTNFLDGYTIPHKFMVGPFTKKDNGTTLSNIGIVGPAAAPASATLGTRSRVVINAMDAIGSWVATGTVGGLATDGTIKQEGSNSLTFAVAENTIATMTLAMTAAPNTVWTGTHTAANGQTSLTDAAIDFLLLPVRLGSTVHNDTQNFTGIVTRIAQHQLFFDAGLGGNVFNNADIYQIYFDLDSFQIVPGTATGTDNSGVNNKAFSLVDTTKDFVRQGVTPGMVLRNTSNGAHGTITSIGTTTNPNDTLHVTGGLSGGSAAVFNSGQGYTVFNDLVKEDDWVHLFVRADFPDRLQYFQIDASIDGAGSGFDNNFYSVRLSPNRLNSDASGWAELFIRKSEFHRSGTSLQGWEHIVSMRLLFQTTATPGGVNIWVDDLSLLGGIGIEGEIAYTAIYVNETTGGMSAPPKDASEVLLFTMAVTAARHPVVLDLTNINSGSTPAPDTQVTHLWIYRQGGGLVAANDPQTGQPALGVFVASVPKATASFTDQRANVQLSPAAILEPDNDPLPSDATIIFGPGALQRLFAIHNRNKVRYSKQWELHKSRAENWPTTFEFQIGDGSQEALNGLVLDQTIFVYSESQDWQVLGQGQDAFVPLPIPLTHGIAAQLGLASGDGQIFKLTRDGIYSQVGLTSTKLTAQIDPFFLGQTVHGQLPLNRDFIGLCRLAWYAHPQDPEVVLLYPELGSGTLKRLVLKKNSQTGQYTDASFDTTANAFMQSVYADPQKLTLTYGSSSGRIYQGEVETANDDDGVEIGGRVRTVASNQGVPRTVKTYSDVVVQANTQGVGVAVTASFDNSTSTIVAGSVIGTTDASETMLPLDQSAPPSVLLRHNIALDLTWSAAVKVTIAQLGWHVQSEAEERIYFDTGTLSLDFINALKWVGFEIDTPQALTITTYIDGQIRDTRPLLPTGGRQRVNHVLPAGLKGRTVRLTGTAAQSFLLYSLFGLMKPWGSETGYREQSLLVAG